MKWIYENSVQSGQVLGLEQLEVDIISSELGPIVKKLKKQYEKYLDIHESGEATEKQQDLMWMYEDKLSLFEHFISESSIRKIEQQ